MNHKRIARKVAARHLQAYEAKGALQKVVGKILTQTFGITDAPESFFNEVEQRLTEELEQKNLTMDLHDPEIYPVLREVIYALVDEDENL